MLWTSEPVSEGESPFLKMRTAIMKGVTTKANIKPTSITPKLLPGGIIYATRAIVGINNKPATPNTVDALCNVLMEWGAKSGKKRE
jgi:hypothetical protein